MTFSGNALASARRRARSLPPALVYAGARALQASAAAPGLVRFFGDRRRYVAMEGAETLRWRDSFPKLTDRLPTSPYDPHYFNQDVWAARRIAEAAPAKHVDVGSRVELVGFLTAITEVVFVDIRPLEAQVENLTSIAGSVLDLPFADASLESVSSLHVTEHIGLGRYGDPLDPLGTVKAARELQRVVRPGGHLLFSLPVGRSRVDFNAHRVHDPLEVRAFFPELELVEFSGVDDAGTFRRNRSPEELREQTYGCGMYQLRRPV